MSMTVRRRPLVEWPRLEDRFDRVFRDLVWDFLEKETAADRLREGWPRSLRLEEYAEEGNWVVRLELPGIDPDKDVDVQVNGGVLEVQARREEHSEERGSAERRSEFRYGSFYRRIPLPEGAPEDGVTASYKDGILEIRVQMPEGGDRRAVTNVAVEKG